MKSPEQEAEEYDERVMLGCANEALKANPALVEVTRQIAKRAHLAGGESMKARILGMLRGDKAIGLDHAARPHGLSPVEWADWVESVLKEGKG